MFALTLPRSFALDRKHSIQCDVNFAPFSYKKKKKKSNRLVGLVVKASASRAEDPGFYSRWRLDFSGSSHTSDLKIDTPVAILPGAWRYRVSAGTGRPGVSIL